MNSENITRKLTTILAADVVGYSNMMATDEESTLRTLRTYRRIFNDLIDKHHGRVFNTAGDAIFAEFDSAVEGVRCAISVQEELKARNNELPGDRKMNFRIGINIGDVMIEGNDLFGDGVNVAARLEGVADPGGVCISSSAFEQVKSKLSIGFKDMGPQEVKNIPHPVGAFQVMAGPISVDAGVSSKGAKAVQWRLPVLTVTILLAVTGLGYFVWKEMPKDTANISSFPANFTTDSMKLGEIKDLMAGITIHGTNRKNRPFILKIMMNETAEIEVERGGKMTGTVFRETGKWWAENYRFCMQFIRFGQGRKLCPRIVRKSNILHATSGDGLRHLNWTFSKP
ncbi:MAG: adenylate/guanylate cyclase domain-containing protein [Rhodospirillales bacterium]